MATCSVRCKNEFRRRNFLLHHDDPQTFVQFQFGAQTAYLMWRLLWAVFFMTWIILFGTFPGRFAWQTRKHQEKWLIYLTDWSFLLISLAVILNFIVVCYVYFKRIDIREGTCTELTWYLKLAWCAVTTANSAALTITIAYWNLVYTGGPIHIMNIVTHAVNTVYVTVNVMLTGMPTRLFHGWFAVTYGTVYGLFSLLYHLAGGTNSYGKPYIYASMNWANTGTTASRGVAIIIGSFISHACFFGFHVLKVHIFEKCCDRKEAMQIISIDVEGREACHCANCDPHVQI